MTHSIVTRTRLDNGLLVVLQETRAAPVASFWVFYRVGSRNELPGTTGLSHWVEHMLFKGTEKYPRGQFDKAVSRAGGVFNGMTSQDWTTYFETFPADRIELALEVESDRMANALFDYAETESERTVILSEREGSENSFVWQLHEEMEAVAFQQHSYRYPTIGWKSDLLAITRDDLYNHYRNYYSPNNAVAVAVGDFNTDDMLNKIDNHFGKLETRASLQRIQVQEPPQISERRVYLKGSDPTGYTMQAFHAPAAIEGDFFPLIILDAVLSGANGMGLFGGGTNNRSNRLYKALVDTHLAVAAGCGYRPTIDPSLFMFYATLTPGTEHRVVEDVIWQEIYKIQEDGILPSELEKAVKQTKAQFAFSSESVTHQAYWLGFSEVVATADWLDNWLTQLSAVTLSDVQRVANHYFHHSLQTAGWYIPEGIQN